MKKYFLFFILVVIGQPLVAVAATCPLGKTCLNLPIGEFGKEPLDANQALGGYIMAWYRFIVGTVGILATVMIMYGGFKWLTSAGDSGKTKEAKEIIISSIIGLALTFLSYTILYFINPRLTAITSPALQKVKLIETNNNPTNNGVPVPKGCCAVKFGPTGSYANQEGCVSYAKKEDCDAFPVPENGDTATFYPEKYCIDNTCQ